MVGYAEGMGNDRHGNSHGETGDDVDLSDLVQLVDDDVHEGGGRGLDQRFESADPVRSKGWIHQTALTTMVGRVGVQEDGGSPASHRHRTENGRHRRILRQLGDSGHQAGPGSLGSGWRQTREPFGVPKNCPDVVVPGDDPCPERLAVDDAADLTDVGECRIRARNQALVTGDQRIQISSSRLP